MVNIDHNHIAGELVADGSIEFSHGGIEDIAAIAQCIPFQMPVFVPCLPSQSLASRLPILEAIHNASLEPVPHIPARHIESETSFNEYLDHAVHKAGVHRALLIGGDQSSSSGPYANVTEMLNAGLLAQSGIREVGFGAYPEGHPGIAVNELLAGLADNIGIAAEQKLGSFIITQFTLTPQRIPDLCSRLASVAPKTPVYAGIPGPATHEQLVHFARYCGVSTSLTAVSGVGVKLPQVVDHERSGQQLKLLASYCASHPSTNLVGVHVYGFGGVIKSANWVQAHVNA